LSKTGPGVEAFLFDPNMGNEVVEGRLIVERWGVRFESGSGEESTISGDGLTAEWDEHDGRIHFRDSSRPGLSIYTFDQSILERPSLASLANLRREMGESAGRRELSRRLRITSYFFGGCVLIAWFISWSTGVMVRSLAEKVPPAWEAEFGNATIGALQAKTSRENYSNQVAQLQVMAAPLLRVIPTAGTNSVKFFIVNDPIPNAFALPGGYVVVNTGLLELTTQPEELLGVLAHELAHVTQKHLVRKLISASGPFLIFGIFLHSGDGLLNTLSLGSGLMVFQGFSKEFETEADEVGWNYLVAADIDPRGMTSVFRKLKDWEKSHAEAGSHLPQAFNSHPLLDKRIARLESKWKKLSRKEGFLVITNPIPAVGPN
jgi:beta-barrel assembly-enhancing protease